MPRSTTHFGAIPSQGPPSHIPYRLPDGLGRNETQQDSTTRKRGTRTTVDPWDPEIYMRPSLNFIWPDHPAGRWSTCHVRVLAARKKGRAAPAVYTWRRIGDSAAYDRGTRRRPGPHAFGAHAE